jgi:hypothetical protein
MPRVLFALLAFVLAASASPSRAFAAAGREKIAVAVWNVTGEPVPEPVQARMRDKLDEGLKVGFDPVPWPEVKKAIESAGVSGCDTVACMRRIGDILFVRRVVVANVEYRGSTNVATHLQLIDLQSGKQLVIADDECTSCRMKEIDESISNTGALLKTKLEALESPAPVVVGPAAATIEKPPQYRRSVPLLAAGGALGALGLAGIIVGGVEASRDQDLCSMIPAGATCARHRDTATGTAVGFGVGVPLLVAGVVMTIYGLRYPIKK